jgi:hypothetical protein
MSLKKDAFVARDKLAIVGTERPAAFAPLMAKVGLRRSHLKFVPGVSMFRRSALPQPS